MYESRIGMGNSVVDAVRLTTTLLQGFKLSCMPFDFGDIPSSRAVALLKRITSLRRDGVLVPFCNEETEELFWRMVQDNGMSKVIRGGDYLVFFNDGHVEPLNEQSFNAAYVPATKERH